MNCSIRFYKINQTFAKAVMKTDLENQLLYIENQENLKVAVASWQKLWGTAYQEKCIREVCRDHELKLHKHPTGQPFLIDNATGISFSHTHSKLAVSASESHQPGVDIEHLREKIFRIAPRVFNRDELDFVAQFPVLQAYHILWGAKEAVYKSDGNKGLVFRTDIRVRAFVFDPVKGELDVELKNHSLYKLRYCFLPDNLVIVYTIGVQNLNSSILPG
jgi:phosphopantetheinyl transferase